MSEQALLFPTVALRGITILPGNVEQVVISRSFSLRAVSQAMEKDATIFVVPQKDPMLGNVEPEDVYGVGTICRIKQLLKLNQGENQVLLEGVAKATVEDMYEEDERYWVCKVSKQAGNDFSELEPNMLQAMRLALQEEFFRYVSYRPTMGKGVKVEIKKADSLEKVISIITQVSDFHFADKQRILEAESPEEEYDVLMEILVKEVDVLKLKKHIQEGVASHVKENQHQFIVKEQLKLLKEELGDNYQDEEEEADELKNRIEALEADDVVKSKLKKELRKLSYEQPGNSEYGTIKTYLETMLELPWNKEGKDCLDIKKARKILDEDHYGLDKVKERILEFLAVRALTKEGDSQIICLVGPPGTGKSSIAKSIARAMNKSFVRVSLGGVKDEAEIRGHRKTYVGAMPGRIVNGLRQAKVCNPVMLLDEVDKMSSNYRGDTASALLEVLDVDQNKEFRDHYTEVPVDLSKVFFICTANNDEEIPRPLWDRMEIIEVSSYTENEKYHIAKDYLWPKQLKKAGLDKSQVKIHSDALKAIISGYTREAGVRSLERKLAKVCRKSAMMILEEEKELPIVVNKKNLEDFLGKQTFREEKLPTKGQVGIANGLAWTSVGGTTLEIEVNITGGSGDIKLTGQMGEVMQESAMIALSFVRGLAKAKKVKDDFFAVNDFHLHIPAGATPKDGPSAGITMAMAFLSAITNRPLRPDVAMTGEITLRGRILPVGGLKEKTLAAKNAGIKVLLVPEKNKPDMEELSEEIVGDMEIHYIKDFKEAEKIAFVQ